MSIRRPTFAILAAVSAIVTGLACLPASSIASRVYAKTGQFGETGVGKLSKPVGIAVNEATGRVYVIDQGNNRVAIFDANGEYAFQFNGGETPAGSFSNPSSIAIDNSSGATKGDVYVTDVGHDVIDAFDSEGKYLSQIAGTPAPFGELLGVSVDGFGHLWVYDSGFVDEFTAGGSLMKEFGTERGASTGFAADPRGTSVDVVFGNTKFGKYNTSTAVAEGEFSEGVTALAISPSYILFADIGGQIEEYGPFDELVEKFAEGQIGGSLGVAVNGADGTVYASSQNETERVDAFDLVVVPDVITGGALNVQQASATVNGTIDAEGVSATCLVEYGTSTSYGSSVPCSPSEVSGGGATHIDAALSNLAANEIYHYRVSATNVNGTVLGQGETFSTFPAPIVSALPASFTTPNSSVLYATVDTRDGSTTYHFVYGPTGDYGMQAPAADVELIATNAGAQKVSQTVEGLQPDTTYHYAIVATNAGGSSQSSDMTFTTASAALPSVLTGVSEDVSQNAAVISGTIDPHGVQSSYEFDLGTDTGYGTRVFGDAGPGSGAETFTLSMQSLAAGTTYHYRFMAKDVFGTVYGVDRTFTTPGFSTALLVAPTTPVLVPTPAFTSPPTTSGAAKASAVAHSALRVKKPGKTIQKKRRKSRPSRTVRVHADRRHK